jgi:hypothetical protein
MKNIIQYLSACKSKQLAILSATPIGSTFLKKMQLNLCLAGEELQRMEDEGGIPLSNQQNVKVAEYLRASAYLKTILHSPQSLSRN